MTQSVVFFVYKCQLQISHEKFEVGICIQKARHFALHDVFKYKKTDTLQKAKKTVLRFYIQKYGHVVLRKFLLNF